MSQSTYRAGKFLAKHRIGLLAIAAIGCAVYVGVSGKFFGSEQPNKPQTTKSETSVLNLSKPSDECANGQEKRLAAAKKQIAEKQFNGAAETLYVCAGRLSKEETQLYEKALTLANAFNAEQVAKAKQQEKLQKKSQGVKIGMTQQDVLDSNWGRPKKVNRTTTANGVREQWVYDGGYLYFSNGVLTTIQN